MRLCPLTSFAIALSACLFSCAPLKPTSGSASSAESLNSQKGKIISIETKAVARPTASRGILSQIGSRLGGAAAGGNVFTSLGGSLGGQYAGQAIAGGGQKAYVSAIEIRLDSGEVIFVESDASNSRGFKVGQRVDVIHSGNGFKIK